MKKWKTLSSKIILPSKWMKINQQTVKLPNGTTLDDYYVWLKGDVVVIVPITPDDELVFVKQYRHGVGKFMIEFPGGIIEKNQDPLKTAKQELKEETDAKGKLKFIGKLYEDPGKIIGKTFVYLATNVTLTKKSLGIIENLEDNEEIEIIKIPFKKAIKMINNGKIWSSETVACFFLALNYLNYSFQKPERKF